MRRYRGLLVHALLVGLGGWLLACGSTAPQLVSITINPATATALDSASGEIQFVATGTYTDGHTVMPLPVFWGEHAPWIMTPDPGGVSVNGNGLAQCTTFKGTVPIVAIAPKDPAIPLAAMTISTTVVSGTAQLTCK
jgi:hypothetical protein